MTAIQQSGVRMCCLAEAAKEYTCYGIIRLYLPVLEKLSQEPNGILYFGRGGVKVTEDKETNVLQIEPEPDNEGLIIIGKNAEVAYHPKNGTKSTYTLQMEDTLVKLVAPFGSIRKLEMLEKIVEIALNHTKPAEIVSPFFIHK